MNKETKYLIIFLLILITSIGLGKEFFSPRETSLLPKQTTVETFNEKVLKLQTLQHENKHGLIDVKFGINEVDHVLAEAKSVVGDAKLALAIYYNRQRKVPTYEQLKSHTVYITGLVPKVMYEDYVMKSEQSWTGTGFVFKVSDKYTWIITNKHVAGIKNNKEGDTTELYIGDTKEERVKAQIVRFHPKYDVALLMVHGRLKGKTQVKGLSTAKPQDKVYVVGHHLGRQYVYGEGVFAGHQEKEEDNDSEDNLKFDLIQIPLLFGNSGSAVFDRNGYVVGLIFAVSRINGFCVDSAHGLAAPGEILQDFLVNWSF